MKIAIVHEMLIKLGGAENVLLDMLSLFPEADVFTLLYDESRVGNVFGRNTITVAKPAQKIYRLLKKPRTCLPWMIRAVESLDLSGYDVVISSSSGFAHGCITGPDTTHIVYYHSPARYLWDATYEVQHQTHTRLHPQIFPSPISIIANTLLMKLRMWDYQAAQCHTVTIANSHEIAGRIRKYYGRIEDAVIYPGVRTDMLTIGDIPLPDRSCYITGGALTPFKRHDVTIGAFNTIGLPLKIFGSGSHEGRLRSLAHDNITFLGHISDEEKMKLFKSARGFIIANKEDFGIVPIEALAAGIPVLAYGRGGVTETIHTPTHGQYFFHQSPEALVDSLRCFHDRIQHNEFEPRVLREHAQKFNCEVFKSQMREIVTKVTRHSFNGDDTIED